MARLPRALLLASAVSAALSVAVEHPALAQEATPVYVVTYFEAAPSTSTEARALLKAFRDASRREEGSVRFDALHRSERPNHFAIVAAWKSEAAQEAHARSPHTKEFREKLQRLLSAAYDERLHIGLSGGADKASGAGKAVIYVLTHVDVIPTFKDQGTSIVKELAEASRKDAGNLRLDALTQANRANHMTLVEAWADRKAFDDHIVAAHVKRFREALGPMSGSLYDERLYTLIE
jgi:quinol monooxygenase YgiN